jgi:hypothetical protein
VKNVVEFLYTGKIILNCRSDFDMFQQLIFEWKIGFDDYPIILDDGNVDDLQNKIRVWQIKLLNKEIYQLSAAFVSLFF